MWKATAAYNFFPTESSGIATFFLMFGREAAVKHTLLESENPKYLGTDDGIINVGLMTMQGLSIPFACVGSGDPVRVLRLYTTNTLDIL